MGKTLLCVLALVLLCSAKEGKRAKELDAEYEKMMGEKVLENGGVGDEETPLNKAKGGFKKTQKKGGFNPYTDLHNEEFQKWRNGEPYMLAKSTARKSEGYVCQQFTLPTNGGTAHKMVGVKDLNACKCACNENRGKSLKASRVGCNAFAYLAGNNVRNEPNVTVNECHMKRHFMYHNDFVKTVNPWIFCVQEGAGAGSNSGPLLADESFVATALSNADSTTFQMMAIAGLMGGLLTAVYFTSCRKSRTNYLLMDTDEI